MKYYEQYQFDSLVRVRDFTDEHAADLGSLVTSEARHQLDEALTQATAFAGDQGALALTGTGQLSREKSLAADLRTRHMQAIATFARARLRGAPDFAALVKSGSKLNGKPLVRAARAMATAAAPHADALTRGGFPSDTVAQLAAAAEALDGAIAERANSKVRRVGATKGIREELQKGREAVAMLDAVITKQFADNKPLLAAWRAARRVRVKPGTPRLTVESGPAGAVTSTAAASTQLASTQPAGSAAA